MEEGEGSSSDNLAGRRDALFSPLPRRGRAIKDYLLERNPRFRKMLDKVRRERHSISLAEYRKSRGI